MKKVRKLTKSKGLINTYKINNIKNNFLNKNTLFKKKHTVIFGKRLTLLKPSKGPTYNFNLNTIYNFLPPYTYTGDFLKKIVMFY